jgi:hypothetical protein
LIIEEGSLVQWISQGVDQFKTPHRVRQIIEDPTYGKFVMVYGSNTGIPYSELVLWKQSSK